MGQPERDSRAPRPFLPRPRLHPRPLPGRLDLGHDVRQRVGSVDGVLAHPRPVALRDRYAWQEREDQIPAPLEPCSLEPRVEAFVHRLESLMQRGGLGAPDGP